jgi:hypothetical protein
VTAAVRDEQGRLLLIHKIDNGYRALPRGEMDLGESIAGAAAVVDPQETLFPLVSALERLGWTRFGSPGIFGYSGG